ncbi:MAG: methyltransferase [Sphingomonas sp.]|uniref:class I SAM-dependent methyltransferase n=1 Tax=Sphingomonas sp. TaxID=28214 RepID=UPI001215EA12|nr:methyltransferase [Sphingomonas sp.]THD36028.1 MAG: methyltransferase [Sphingomonas sp.]
MKLILAAALLAATATSGTWLAAATRLPANIAKAAADPARADQAVDDARRHGPEILAFAGVKPGDKVVDLQPNSAYWTRLFAGAVGPRGKVYGVWVAPLLQFTKDDETKYLAAAGKTWPNVVSLEQPADGFATPEPADIIFTSQNYHDYLDKFMGPVDPAVLDKRFFDALKPGGYFIVIDHVALPGTGTDATEKLHRIDPALVKKQVTAAGFRFVGESTLLANPKDDHMLNVFKPEIRGHTDQFVYKFRKPL